jgi:uncharacterized RDD family membrane protein YckC
MSKPDYLISTPENLDLHLELAGLGNRVLAALIDTLLTWTLVLLLVLACTLALGLTENSPLLDNLRTVIDYCVIAVAVLLALIILFGYFILFEGTWHGQTPGKKVARIRVIEQTGQPVTWPAVIIRNLIRTVDVGLMLIGLACMLVDRNERRLGDLAAGTLVIRERHPAEGSHSLKISAGDSNHGFVDIGGVTPQEYELLVSFLGRREHMSKNERPLLAKKLDNYFKVKLQAHDSTERPEDFLEKIYLAYHARAEQAAD